MSVTLPKHVLETLSQNLVLQDGQGVGNLQKSLDSGDKLTLKRSWLPDKSVTVTDADVASYASLARLLQNLVGDRVDLVSTSAGEFECLVYRQGKELGSTQVINRYGQNLISFPGIETEADIDRTLSRFAGKCPQATGDDDCLKKLAQLAVSAMTYQGNLEDFQKKHTNFWNDADVTLEDVTFFTQSAQAYSEAYTAYQEDKALLEDRLNLTSPKNKVTQVFFETYMELRDLGILN